MNGDLKEIIRKNYGKSDGELVTKAFDKFQVKVCMNLPPNKNIISVTFEEYCEIL